MQCHRAGRVRLLRGHQCVRKGPAASAGSSSPTRAAVPCLVPVVITFGAAVSAREVGRRCQQALHLGRALQRHRAGGAHILRSRQGGRKGPAAPASLTSLTCVAVPFHRPGCDHVRRSRQCARKGPAVSAGLASLTHEAAPCPRPGWDYGLCSRPCAQERASRSAGRTYPTCDAAPSCRWQSRTVQPSVRAKRTSSVSRPHILCSMQRLAVVPGVITCCAAVRACEKGQQDQQALQPLRAMQRQVAVPEVMTCWAPVSACGKAQQCLQASLLSRAMQRQAIVPVAITHDAAVSLPQAVSCNAAPCLTARRDHARGGRHRGRRGSRALAYPRPATMSTSCSPAPADPRLAAAASSAALRPATAPTTCSPVPADPGSAGLADPRLAAVASLADPRPVAASPWGASLAVASSSCASELADPRLVALAPAADPRPATVSMLHSPVPADPRSAELADPRLAAVASLADPRPVAASPWGASSTEVLPTLNCSSPQQALSKPPPPDPRTPIRTEGGWTGVQRGVQVERVVGSSEGGPRAGRARSHHLLLRGWSRSPRMAIPSWGTGRALRRRL